MKIELQSLILCRFSPLKRGSCGLKSTENPIIEPPYRATSLKIMKSLNSLLIIVIALLTFACSNEEPSVQDTPILSINDTIVRINNIDEYWDYVLFKDKSQIICIKENINELTAIGVLGSDTISLITDNKKNPVTITMTNLRLNLENRNDSTIIHGITNEIMFTDTIPHNSTIYNSRAEKNSILSSISSWALDKIISTNTDKVMDGIPFSDLVKFLRDLDDRNTYEQLDYITDKLENWQGEILEIFNIIPADWWKEFLDKLKQKDKDSCEASTIVMGLSTGSAINVSQSSVTCFVTGILEADAKGSELDFSYGICYSLSSIPTINDLIVSKNVIVQKNYSIKLPLPEKFILDKLNPNSIYFYRAYIIDNLSKEVYYSDIKSFNTSQYSPNITNLRQIEGLANYDGFPFNGNRYQYKYLISLHIARDKASDYKSWGIYYNDGTSTNYIEIPTSTYGKDISIELYSAYKEISCKVGWYIENETGKKILGGEETLKCQCTTKPSLKYHIVIKSHQEFNITPTDILVDTIISVYPDAETQSFHSIFKQFTINQNKSNWLAHSISLVYCESDFYRNPFLNNYDFTLSNLFLSYSLDSRMWSAGYYFNIANQTNVSYSYKSEPDLYISNNKRIDGYERSNFNMECSVESVYD